MLIREHSLNLNAFKLSATIYGQHGKDVTANKYNYFIISQQWKTNNALEPVVSPLFRVSFNFSLSCFYLSIYFM